jgi:hypothetical protein
MATGHQLTLMTTVLSRCYMTSCYIILGRNSPKLIYGNHGNDALIHSHDKYNIELKVG